MENNQKKLSYQLLDRNNPVFSDFIVWSSILIIKLILMSGLTAFHRIRTKVQWITSFGYEIEIYIYVFFVKNLK